eukprot:gene14866-biopygen11176
MQDSQRRQRTCTHKTRAVRPRCIESQCQSQNHDAVPVQKVLSQPVGKYNVCRMAGLKDQVLSISKECAPSGRTSTRLPLTCPRRA